MKCEKWTDQHDLSVEQRKKKISESLPGHGFDSCQGLDFFFVPHSSHVDQFTFQMSWPTIRIWAVSYTYLQQSPRNFRAFFWSFKTTGDVQLLICNCWCNFSLFWFLQFAKILFRENSFNMTRGGWIYWNSKFEIFAAPPPPPPLANGSIFRSPSPPPPFLLAFKYTTFWSPNS